MTLHVYIRVYRKGNKIWYAENFSAYGVTSILLLFCTEAPYNFLEREIGMKREVIVGKPLPIYFLPWLTTFELLASLPFFPVLLPPLSPSLPPPKLPIENRDSTTSIFPTVVDMTALSWISVKRLITSAIQIYL